MPDRDDEFPDVEFFADPPDSNERRSAREEPTPPPESEPADLPGVGDGDDLAPFSLGEETGEHEEVAKPRRRFAVPGVRRRSRDADAEPDAAAPVDEGDPDEGDPDESGGGRGGGKRRRRGGGDGGGGGGDGGGRGPRRRRSGGGGSKGGASGGAAVLQQPAARIALAAAFVGVLVLVLVLVVRECQRSQLESSYKTYMSEVSTLVAESSEQGKQLRVVLNNASGDNPPTLRMNVTQLRDQAQALVDRSDQLDPPGKLSGAQRSLVTTLEYRVTGLSQLAESLPTIIESRDNQFAASALSKPMQRFLSSDVIYDDSFAGPARQALDDDNIDGVEVPADQPFLPNPAFAAPGGAKSLLPGLRRTRPAQQSGGDSGSGNLRGTSLVKTEALPSGTRLTPDSVTTVQASEELKWRVTVENGGDFVENGVVVRAQFSYPETPDDAQSQEAEIDTIAPGDQVSVEIAGPTQPNFGEQGTLEIEIVPVPNETRVDNNRATYPVTITI